MCRCKDAVGQQTHSQSASVVPRTRCIWWALSTRAHSQRSKTLALAKGSSSSRNTKVFMAGTMLPWALPHRHAAPTLTPLYGASQFTQVNVVGLCALSDWRDLRESKLLWNKLTNRVQRKVCTITLMGETPLWWRCFCSSLDLDWTPTRHQVLDSNHPFEEWDPGWTSGVVETGWGGAGLHGAFHWGKDLFHLLGLGARGTGFGVRPPRETKSWADASCSGGWSLVGPLFLLHNWRMHNLWMCLSL